MSSSSKSAPKQYITERKINIPFPKAMPLSIQRAMGEEIKADIEEWKKQYAAIKNHAAIKKEKDARKSPRKRES